MNKKKIIILTVLGAVLIGGAILWIVGNQKTEWVDSVGGFGPLNLMELNSDCDTNASNFTWVIDEYTDFQFGGQLLITEGSVLLKYSIGDIILSEETYGPGTYEIESPVYSGYNGEIIVAYYPTDDVQGSYDLVIYTRTTKFNKFLQKYDLK